MGHFYVWHFNKRKRWLTLIFASAIIAVILFGTLYFSKDKEKMVISKGNTKDEKIALTFNLSWGDEKVYDILDVLKKHQVEATFFLSGEWLERHPQIVERIQVDKHEIGMLGYRYKNYEQDDIEQIKKDMIFAKEIFKKFDIETTLVRSPTGVFNKETLELTETLGLEAVHWSIDSEDQNNNEKQLIKHLIKQTDNGDILLFHASDVAKHTAEALDTILPALKQNQLTPVTITELIEETSIEERQIE